MRTIFSLSSLFTKISPLQDADTTAPLQDVNTLEAALETALQSSNTLDSAMPAPILPQPTNSAPVLFHSNLLDLSYTLSGISLTHDLGKQLGALAYKMSLSHEDLDPITESIKKFIPSYQAALAQLQDTPDLLKQFATDCSNLSLGHLPQEIPLYEDLADHPGIALIKKEAQMLTLLYKLAPELFTPDDTFSLLSLLQGYTNVLPQVNNFLMTAQSLLPVSNQLRQEIIAFGNKLNELQNNKTLAVNWNSQKPAFIKLREELDARRNQYLTEEDKLNNAISEVYTELRALHTSFVEYRTSFASAFEALIETTPSNPQIISQRQQINQTIIALTAVQNTLVSYTHTLAMS